MSLIQQALEKTSRLQAAHQKAAIPFGVWQGHRDPMGTALEEELVKVQKSYRMRRRFYKILSFGILVLGVSAGIFFYLRQWPQNSVPVKIGNPVSSNVPTVIAPAVPRSLTPKIAFMNVPFHLTGITTFGQRTMAVIDGQIVGVGDSVSGKAVVKDVGNGKVLLDVRGKEIQLNL